MSGRWVFFVLGFATGMLGATMYRRMQEDCFGEDVDALRDRLSENVKTLEERIGAIIEATKGGEEANANE